MAKITRLSSPGSGFLPQHVPTKDVDPDHWLLYDVCGCCPLALDEQPPILEMALNHYLWLLGAIKKDG